MAPQQPAIRKKKITVQEAEAIADLCAQRLNETEACLVLDINPRTWFQWKRRHAVEFEAVFTRVRAEKIVSHMNNIEAAGAKDWRASAHLLKIIDPVRFGDKPAAVQVNVSAVDDSLLLAALKRVYGVTREVAEGKRDETLVLPQ